LTHAYASEGSILLVSGNSFYNQLAYAGFNNDSDMHLLNTLGPDFPQSLQTVDYTNLNLVAGEKLVIRYDFYAGDNNFNDFAFGMLKAATGETAAALGATENYFVATGRTAYQMTFTINTSGVFNLLMGVADVGDMLKPSAMVIEGVSIEVPAGGYTLSASGVQLSDGSKFNPDGSAVLANGTVVPGQLDQASQNLITTLDSKVASGLIGEDGSSLISQEGGGLIGEDGSSLIGEDGSSLIGEDGSSLISQDGNGITQISETANPVIALEGTGLIGEDGSSLISQDGNGLAQLQGTGAAGLAPRAILSAAVAGRTFTSTPVTLPGGGPAVPGQQFLVSPPAAVGSSLYDGQTYVYGINEQMAALSTGKFAVSWTVEAQYGSPLPFSIGVQLMNADGTPSGSPYYISSAETATENDVVSNISSITALAGGGFAVTYAEQIVPYSGNGQTEGVYTQIFDASGNALGNPHLVNPYARQIASATLSDGSFVTIVTGYAGAENAPYLLAQRVGADGTPIGAAIPLGPDSNLATYESPSVVGLQNGAFAVAYESYPPAGDTISPTGLVWQVVNADDSVDAPILVTNTGVSPALAVLTNGDIVVAWTGSDAAHAQIYAPDGAKIGSEIVGESTLGVVDVIGDGSPPAITALADGRFMLAYDIAIVSPTFGNLTGIDTHAQIFNADGTASGSVFEAAPSAAGGNDTDNTQPAAVQLADGTVEIAVHYQAGPFSSDIRAEPVSVAQTVPTSAIAVPVQDRATDGYISGATVFPDANGNGVLDTGEASATTDSYGRFTFTTTPSGPLVMTGGTDTSTGLANTQTLTAPAGGSSVTPLSTLVQKLVASGDTLTSAELAVNKALGLPADTDLSAFDPVLATLRSDASGQQGFVLASTIANVVRLAIAAGASGDIYGKLAAEMAASPGPFDPTALAAMQGLGLTGADAQAASSLAAAAQALAIADMTKDATLPTTLLNDVASIDSVEQGTVAAALAAGVASNNLEPVIAAYTGANLEDAVTLLCYLRGTRIMTPSGEVPVEALRIGGGVATRFGGVQKIKWIGRQSFAPVFARNNHAKIPVRIAAGALGPKLPKRDLCVSPGHSMLINGILVLAEALVNGVTITQDWAGDDIHYVQLEFESHDCVLAEGAWSESFADGPGMRGMFQNAAEFYEMFPGYREPDKFKMCAPRPEAGAALEAALRPVLSRAGGGAAGPLRGWIDHADGDVLEGWAVDAAEPAWPVILEVLLGDWVLGETLACGYREDLEKSGFRQGWCGLVFSLPENLPLSARRNLRVRRAGGGLDLPMTAECLQGLGIGASPWRLVA
jgi:hypothetical protein